MESLKKEDLISKVSERSELTKTDVTKALKAIQDVIMEAVARGDKVSLPGFVSFSPSVRSARDGRNPRTGEVIYIPEQRSVRISPLKAFKEIIANSSNTH